MQNQQAGAVASVIPSVSTFAEQITNLIAQRPGIRNIEIADELGLDPAEVRPIIKGRIENSRIIVDKVQGINGLVNAYRMNPKWKASDADFVPVKRDPEDDGEPGFRPARKVLVPAPAPVAAEPVKDPIPPKRKYTKRAGAPATTPVKTTPPPALRASDRQVGGTHYRDMAVTPWDALEAWLTPEELRGYHKGTVIAYLARERAKGGDQDIGKAHHHLQRLLELIEEAQTK